MRDISAPRFAKSYLTAAGPEIVTGVFDFQLGPRMGVAVMDVIGWVKGIDYSAIGTVLETNQHTQSLHLETGTLELPSAPGVDETIIDSEIFFVQTAVLGGITTAAAGAGFGVHISPNGLVHYDPPVLTVRNITHRVESEIPLSDLEAGVLMRYKFVEFTLEEMGLLLALRS